VADTTDRFLDAYARTERYLREVVGAERGVPYGQLVREATRRDRIVRRFRDDLLEFGELRNAIVHQRSDGHPIAAPFEATAAQLERIAGLMDRPPRVAERFVRKVSQAGAHEPVDAVLRRMRDGDFSVVPVYEHDRFAGLLTSTAIVRWLADVLGGDGDLGARPVRDVLTYCKHVADRVRWLAETATAIEAVEAFQDASERGHKLDAILLTHSGRSEERILGIITVADVPALLEMIGR
jgi:CBS domain-containing protein